MKLAHVSKAAAEASVGGLVVAEITVAAVAEITAVGAAVITAAGAAVITVVDEVETAAVVVTSAVTVTKEIATNF